MADAARATAGIDSFAVLITYMFRVIDPMNLNDLRAKIRLLPPNAEEAAMSIAEQFHEEGREEGRKEGRITTLRRQLVVKFHTLDPSHETCLQAATPEAIDRYLERVLFADSLAAVFQD